MSHQINTIRYEDRHKIRDIYIPLESKDGKYAVNELQVQDAYCYTGKPEAMLLFDQRDAQMMTWFLNLYSGAQAAAEQRENFRLEHDGVLFRATRRQTVKGIDLALRAIPTQCPHLGDLKMPNVWKDLTLDHELLDGGLMLIVATNGQGKTTHASAAVTSRLMQYAGFAVTVEDPPELDLQNWIGKGRCNQLPVSTPAGGSPGSGFAEALVNARRYFPTITGGGTQLMIGEIRNSETAAETLLAANEGHFVIATMHAPSIAHGLLRIVSMATEKLGPTQAREALAASLRICIYQRLILQDQGTMWERGKYVGDILWSPGSGSPVAEELLGFDMKTINKRVAGQRDALAKFSDTSRPRLQDIKDALKMAKLLG